MRILPTVVEIDHFIAAGDLGKICSDYSSSRFIESVFYPHTNMHSRHSAIICLLKILFQKGDLDETMMKHLQPKTRGLWSLIRTKTTRVTRFRNSDAVKSLFCWGI